MNRKWKAAAVVAVLIGLATAERAFERAALAQRKAAPAFQVDPMWPKMPRQWILGRIGHYAGEFVFLHNVAVDSKGDVYTTEVGGGRRVQKFLVRP